MLTAFDYETSRFPDGSAYRKEAKAVSWAEHTDTGSSFHYYTDPDFTSALQSTLDKTTLLIVINGKFELAWTRRLGCSLPDGVRIWDCQVAEYVLSGQTKSFTSMDELCELYGIEGKNGGLEDWWNQGIETANIPREIVEAYNLGDVGRTLQIYHAQLKDPRLTSALHKLILLHGLDLIVLQEMEQNGILYDKERSITEGDRLQIEIDKLREELQDVIQFKHFNLDSGDHLSCFLYGGCVAVDLYQPVELVYKSGPHKGTPYTQNQFKETVRREFPGLFKPLPRTELKKKGRIIKGDETSPSFNYYKTGEPILKQLKCRTKQQRKVIDSLLQLAEFEKQRGSFLHAIPILMEKQGWDDNIIHPEYNQCVARTGRLSCSKPNAQQWDEVTCKNWITRYE